MDKDGMGEIDYCEEELYLLSWDNLSETAKNDALIDSLKNEEKEINDLKNNIESYKKQLKYLKYLKSEYDESIEHDEIRNVLMGGTYTKNYGLAFYPGGETWTIDRNFDIDFDKGRSLKEPTKVKGVSPMFILYFEPDEDTGYASYAKEDHNILFVANENGRSVAKDDYKGYLDTVINQLEHREYKYQLLEEEYNLRLEQLKKNKRMIIYNETTKEIDKDKFISFYNDVNNLRAADETSNYKDLEEDYELRKYLSLEDRKILYYLLNEIKDEDAAQKYYDLVSENFHDRKLWEEAYEEFYEYDTNGDFDDSLQYARTFLKGFGDGAEEMGENFAEYCKGLFDPNFVSELTDDDKRKLYFMYIMSEENPTLYKTYRAGKGTPEELAALTAFVTTTLATSNPSVGTLTYGAIKTTEKVTRECVTAQKYYGTSKTEAYKYSTMNGIISFITKYLVPCKFLSSSVFSLSSFSSVLCNCSAHGVCWAVDSISDNVFEKLEKNEPIVITDLTDGACKQFIAGVFFGYFQGVLQEVTLMKTTGFSDVKDVIKTQFDPKLLQELQAAWKYEYETFVKKGIEPGFTSLWRATNSAQNIVWKTFMEENKDFYNYINSLPPDKDTYLDDYPVSATEVMDEYLSDKINLTDKQKMQYDLNGDGIINGYDKIILQKIYNALNEKNRNATSSLHSQTQVQSNADKYTISQCLEYVSKNPEKIFGQDNIPNIYNKNGVR